MTNRGAPRIPSNLHESSLIYIGDNHYVDPATGMILSRIGHISVLGYEKVQHNGVRAASVHRLVYEAVHGPIPEGLVINHINGIRDDNRPDNLEAVTYAENHFHMLIMGRNPSVKPRMQGENHYAAKVSDAQVEEIRRRFATGENVPSLAAEYGLSRSHTYKLIRNGTGRGRKYGSGPETFTRPRDKTTPEQRHEIARRVLAGETAPKLAEEFEISTVHVYKIAREINGASKEFRKVTKEQRLEIFKRRNAGERPKDLAAEFGLTRGHVTKIVREVRKLMDAEGASCSD